MRVRAPYSILLLSFLSVSTVPAFALPGEAAAVIQHCGTPASDIQQPGNLGDSGERQFLYNDLTLVFQPQDGGWSFSSAWSANHPINRSELEQRLPCFHDAMQQAAAHQSENPILYQTAQASYSAPFGIPYFWLLVFLTLLLLVITFWLPRHSRRGYIVEDVRHFRRPAILATTEEDRIVEDEYPRRDRFGRPYRV